ncbi:P-loop containing nucleoside triphosphate hydrolases superfamily protein [Quillaja saponaria]|uniref:P-loop containing nucleoside triphosphate hydrolases superfamily protein n=1 Tax=Quillaja saponaria TaxID=32244 RepID=A0AAD7VMR6_QUISA|nr:P-loop containing nucleoside triphosphate hydrolases superfamily protein [Quillaja saponaria]
MPLRRIKQLKFNDASIQLTNNINEADAILALQSKFKKNPVIQTVPRHDIPTYVTKVTKCNTVFLVEQLL